MRRSFAIFVLAWLILLSCGPKPPPPRVFPPPPADHLRVAKAEAERSAGVPELIELSRAGDPEVSRRALRGLGRVGDPEAIAALATGEGPLSLERATALALTGDVAHIARLVDTFHDAATLEAQRAALSALGRLGGEAEIAILGEGLMHEAPSVRAVAGLALGLRGRREHALTQGVRERLEQLATDGDREIRYGVAYALAREHGGNGADLLRRMAGDSDPEIRALAIFGCARRGAGDLELYTKALADADWRVRVEAARAASSADASPELRAALAGWIVEQVEQGDLEGPASHPVFIGLTRLADFVESEAVRAAFDRVYASLSPGRSSVRGALHCTAAFARVRAGAALEDLVKCGGDPAGWPLHERRRLLADILKDGTTGVLEDRMALLESLGADPDPRVRAAAIGAGLVSEDDEVRELARGLALLVLQNETSMVVVGTVIEVIAAEGMTLSPELQTALLDRARREQAGDAELRLTIIEALRVSNVRESREVLEATLADANVTLRTAAREALLFLFPEEEHQAATTTPPAPPPVAVAEVLDRRILWHLNTNRGDIVIELWPEVAPWSVATLVSLAKQGSYDGTPWHRVVPGFVVQGGDPTGSGWGGPGFAIPGEPSILPFVRGAVGIADAGKDTGGSQFFIMQARAPHLEGRYTLVGRVESGQEAVDAAIVGDQILRSWIYYP